MWPIVTDCDRLWPIVTKPVLLKKTFENRSEWFQTMWPIVTDWDRHKRHICDLRLEWLVQIPFLFAFGIRLGLALSDSSKPAPYFTVHSVKCNWSRIQSKKSCLRRNLFHKFCLQHTFFIKNLETVCLRLSVPLPKIGTRTGASLSSIRKDRN